MMRLRGLAALATLAALLIGLPIALLQFGRWPIDGTPTSDTVGSLGDRLVSDTAVFGVLTLAAGTIWLLFLFSIGVEVVAVLRRAPTPHLRLAGPTQHAARVLVAAVVLAMTWQPAAGHATIQTTPSAPSGPSPTATPPTLAAPLPDTPVIAVPGGAATVPARASVTVARGDSAWSMAEAHLGDGMRWRELWDLNREVVQPDGRTWHDPQQLDIGWTLLLPSDAAASDAPMPGSPPPADYVVVPGDTLSDIADDHLGDPDRYTDVFDLNEGVTQPDGRRLEDPDLIIPGWHLTIPLERAAVDTPTLVLDPVPVPEPVPEPPADVTEPPSPTTEPVTPATDEVPSSDTTRPTIDQPEVAGEVPSDDADAEGWFPATTPTVAGITGAVALASGLLMKLRRQRHRAALRGANQPRPQATDRTTEIEGALVAAADVPFIRWAGHALAELAADLEPPITAAPLAVELTPGERIEVLWDAQQSGPIPGWQPTEDGWGAERTYDPEEPVPSAELPSPVPALVTIGTRQGRPLLLNLEAVGVLNVTGDPDRVSDFVRAVTVELSTGEDIADSYLFLIDAGPVVPTERVEIGTADDAARRIPSFAAAVEATLDDARAATTFAARCGPDASPLEAMVVVSTTNDPDLQAAVAEVRPHRGVAVVLAHSPVSAGAVLDIDASGRARLDPIGIELDAAQLAADLAQDLADLITEGDLGRLGEDRQLPIFTVDLTSPSPELPSSNGHHGLPPAPDDLDEPPGVSPLDAQLVVRVLGTPRVPDRPDLKRRELILTVFLACRGGAVNASAVQDAIWNGQAVQGKTLWNLVGRTRTALGHLPDGTWVLQPSDRNRHMKGLSPGVTTDLAILRHLYDEAQQVSSSEAIALLRRGLALVEGPPFDADGFDWAHHGTQHVAEASALIERSAENLVNLALDADDIDAAREAVVQGLRGLPGDEVLYRLRMRVEHHAGNPAGVAAAYDELIRYLDEFDAEPSPSTLDLHRLLSGTARAGS